MHMQRHEPVEVRIYKRWCTDYGASTSHDVIWGVGILNVTYVKLDMGKDAQGCLMGTGSTQQQQAVKPRCVGLHSEH